MADNSYQASDLGGAQPGYQPSPIGGAPATTVAPSPMTMPAAQPKPSGAYSPSDINAGLVARGVPPADAVKLTATTGAESRFGKNQIGSLNPNGSRDFGLGQINNKAWPQLNPPSLVHAPLGQQLDAIVYVYNHQGLPAWVTYKSGAYKNYLEQVNSTIPTGAGGATTTPGTTVNTTTPAQAAGIGAMWGALNADTGGGLKPTSTMDNLGRMVSDTPSSAPNTYQTMANYQLQQAAAPGNARQAQIAGQAAQLAATLQQHAAQPLTWSTRPFGSTAGPQTPQIPGTTLTSTGGSVYG